VTSFGTAHGWWRWLGARGDPSCATSA